MSNSLVSARIRFVLIVSGLAGIALVLVAASRYGVGLTPDSEAYVSAARNMASGHGLAGYNGLWPPLFPLLLALMRKVTGLDPVDSARLLNAMAFGMVVYCSGLLVSRHCRHQPWVSAVGGALAVLLSIPLLQVSVMVFTEPLFILFTLLSLICLEVHLETGRSASLVESATLASLAALTRYAGVAVVAAAIVSILLCDKSKLSRKVTHSLSYGLIASLPLAVWLVRNYLIYDTLFGPRVPSTFTMSQNLSAAFETALVWCFPSRLAKSRFVVASIFSALSFLAGFSSRGNWSRIGEAARKAMPLMLFIGVYLSFLVATSTARNYETIDNRILSPIYPAAVAVAFVAVEQLLLPFEERFSHRVVDGLFVSLLAAYLAVFSLRQTFFQTKNWLINGVPYSHSTWQWPESDLMRILRQTLLREERPVYSNCPEVLYVLAGMDAKLSLARTWSDSAKPRDSLGSPKRPWPDTSGAYLTWCESRVRAHLYTVEELCQIPTLDALLTFPDGAVYLVSCRK